LMNALQNLAFFAFTHSICVNKFGYLNPLAVQFAVASVPLIRKRPQ
ncbi:MAG: hypothetical protein ACI9L9_002362, partial [Marivirga sp.]